MGGCKDGSLQDGSDGTLNGVRVIGLNRQRTT